MFAVVVLVVVVMIVVALARGGGKEESAAGGRPDFACHAPGPDGWIEDELEDGWFDEFDSEFASPRGTQGGRVPWESKDETAALGGADYFQRLMEPGSEEAAWFNAAEEQGWRPEDW